MKLHEEMALIVAFGVAIIAGLVIGVLDLTLAETLAAGLGTAAVILLVVGGWFVVRRLRRVQRVRERHEVPGQLHIPV